MLDKAMMELSPRPKIADRIGLQNTQWLNTFVLYGVNDNVRFTLALSAFTVWVSRRR